MPDTIQDLLALAEDDPAEFNRRCVKALGNRPGYAVNNSVCMLEPTQSWLGLFRDFSADHNHAAELVAKAVERDSLTFSAALRDVLATDPPGPSITDTRVTTAPVLVGIIMAATATPLEKSVAALATLERGV